MLCVKIIIESELRLAANQEGSKPHKAVVISEVANKAADPFQHPASTKAYILWSAKSKGVI